MTIDNGPAEQAIRPLCVGRRNWLHLGGDGALDPTAVLLSVTASVKRHGLDLWVYLKHVLTELPACPPRTDLSDLLPDRWARSRSGPMAIPGYRLPAHLARAETAGDKADRATGGKLRALLGAFPQSSFRIVPRLRFFLNSALLLSPDRSR